MSNSPQSDLQERYSPGYRAELISSYQSRIVDSEAGFFHNHLRPGMNLLDAGCGPGTITVGLAKVVAPGNVTGIDIEESQVDKANEYSHTQAVSNVRFQVGNIYELPFEDETFDGAFANALLQHLKNPLAALEELCRVIKRGGIIGVRDDDLGSMIFAPLCPRMERALELFKKITHASGGDPFVGRWHRSLLRQAGFTRTQGSASVEYDGTLETTTKRGDLAAVLLEHMTETAVLSGLASVDEMKALARACKEWGRRPDAFDAITWCEAIGWKE
jgi:ubiquinone/menaquinone biosynthesis C-methylase UbiE